MKFLKNMADKVNAKAQEKAKELVSKEHLFAGEEIKMAFAGLKDFAAITNKRIIIRDSETLSTKAIIASIPLKNVIAVEVETSKALLDFQKVAVVTSSGKYDLKLANDVIAKEFYNAVLEIIL